MRVSFIVLQRFKRASSLCGSSFRNLTASTSTRSTTRILLWRPGNWSASESRGHNKCGPINKQIGRCILKAFSGNWTLNFRTTDNDQQTHLCEKRSKTDSRFSLRNWCTHNKLSTRVNNCFLLCIESIMHQHDSLFSSVSVSPSFLRSAVFSSSSCAVTSLWLTDDSFWISSTDFSRSLGWNRQKAELHGLLCTLKSSYTFISD